MPLPEFKCYSKDPCKKLETQEDALKDLDLDQECLPSICTVSRQDFPLYLRAVQAADASKAVGSVALALSTLGHLPRCAQDDADMFLDRVDVDSDDASIRPN